MRAFILASGADTGGAAIRTVELFRDDPEWEVRAMVAAKNYIDYPADVPYDRVKLIELYRGANVVMLNNTLYGHHEYGARLRKPTILMHHGLHEGHFKQSIEQVVAECEDIGITQTGSTVNLELYGPIQWTPIAYGLGGLRLMRQRYVPSEFFRVAHAPTNRAVKSTEAFMDAISSLQQKGLPIREVLIENLTHAQTMDLKARKADLLVDQLKLGYGCNAIEAWGMGIPVIGAVNDHPEWRTHMINRYDLTESPTGLPFYEATEATLADAIEAMYHDAALRTLWADVGTAHVKRWHNHTAGRRIYSEVFDSAMTRRPRRTY